MALFKTMKPRAYRHEYIYYNERKEKLNEIRDKAKRELGWEAKFGIEEMCRDSWNFQKNNPNGYDN